MARYGLFVLKVPLSPQPTNRMIYYDNTDVIMRVLILANVCVLPM